MTDNPLIVLGKNTAPKNLDAYCQWLNGMEWVRQTGVPYTIGEREGVGGVTERFLTRANV